MIVRFGLLSIALFLFVGCGSEEKPPVYKVVGTVTYDGKAIPKGSIVFDPVDGKAGSNSGAIVDGLVELDVQPGQKIVRISAERETGQKDEYGEIVTESYIPAKHNLNSQLKFEVKPDQVNSFQFNLAK